MERTNRDIPIKVKNVLYIIISALPLFYIDKECCITIVQDALSCPYHLFLKLSTAKSLSHNLLRFHSSLRIDLCLTSKSCDIHKLSNGAILAEFRETTFWQSFTRDINGWFTFCFQQEAPTTNFRNFPFYFLYLTTK